MEEDLPAKSSQFSLGGPTGKVTKYAKSRLVLLREVEREELKARIHRRSGDVTVRRCDDYQRVPRSTIGYVSLESRGFTGLGFQQCDGSGTDAGYAKVALYEEQAAW